MKFSERMGIEPATKSIQIDYIDTDLINTLWSLLTLHYWNRIQYVRHPENHIDSSNLSDLFFALWIDYFKLPIDTMPILFNGGYNNGGMTN